MNQSLYPKVYETMRLAFALLISLLLFTSEGKGFDQLLSDEITSQDKKEHIDTLLMQAASYKKNRDYQHAIRLYNKASEIALNEKDFFRQSTVHYYLGEIYLDINNYTMAIAAFENCIKLEQKVYRPELFAMIAFHLGNIYHDFNNFDLALDYYRQALNQFDLYNRPHLIGDVLEQKGNVYTALEDSEMAIQSYLKALEYKRDIYSPETASLLMKIGEVYLKTKELDLSLAYLKQALDYSAIGNDTLNQGKILSVLGLAYFNNGDYRSADESLEQAKQEAIRIGDKAMLAEVYKQLALTNEKLNAKSKEVAYFRQYINLKDSLLSIENRKRIDEMKAEFEMQNKKKAIEILEHQKDLLSSEAMMKDMAYRSNRTLLIFFTCLIVLSILLLVLLMRRHIAKKKTNLMLQNHLAEARQQKIKIEVQRDEIEQSRNKLEQARKTIIQKNKLLQENNAFLERTVNERTLELFKAYQKLTFHVDNTALAVMEFNNRLELIRWSDQAERIFGWKKEEVVGKRFHEIGFVLEKDTDEVIKMMHDLLYGESPRIYFQAINCNKFNDILHIEWNTSVLLSHDGSVDSIMAIANDVTSREQAFTQLKASHRELDNFIYKASHDLRGPLARMQGIVNLGLMEAKEKLSRDYFAMLQITGTQLNNILSRLLMIYDINHHNLVWEKVILKKKIQSVLDELRSENDHFNIRFHFNISDELTWETDLVLLGIIVRNMFDNALFFRDKKEISVKIEAHRIYYEKLLIKITDNGIGIPASARDKVFDMFFHGSARSGGTGLGLYMAKKAVERLGGNIKLANGEAKNTMFEIVLPLISKDIKVARQQLAEDNKLN